MSWLGHVLVEPVATIGSVCARELRTIAIRARYVTLELVLLVLGAPGCASGRLLAAAAERVLDCVGCITRLRGDSALFVPSPGMFVGLN